jgi:hypothetical protein
LTLEEFQKSLGWETQMKKIMTNIVLIGLLFSMAAAKSDNKKDTKKGARPAAAAADKAKSFDGWVSDEKCGARIDAACSKVCQAAGAKLVFVNIDKTVIPVANQQSLNAFTGQHVNIVGKLENGILTVSSVKAATR